MVLDLIAALLITYGFYIGFSRGLVKTVVDTLSILIALVVALKFSPLLIEYFQEILRFHPSAEFILGFLFVFFLTLLIFKFIGDKIEDLLKAVGINFINQLAGGALLGLVFAFCIGALLALATNLKLLPDTTLEQSRLYGYLIDIGKEGWGVLDTFKSIFSEFWTKFMDTLDQVKEQADQKI